MEKQQTAVEWLADICKNRGYHFMEEYFKQAKEMERKQIIDAHLLGLIYPLEIEATKQAEQYYNETYGDERNTKSI